MSGGGVCTEDNCTPARREGPPAISIHASRRLTGRAREWHDHLGLFVHHSDTPDELISGLRRCLREAKPHILGAGLPLLERSRSGRL